LNRFMCSIGTLQNYSIIALSFLRNCGKKVTPQPASLLLPLPPPTHVRGKRPVNPYIGVLAQKDACMTTKISILKSRSGWSMAYVVTFDRAMATGRDMDPLTWLSLPYPAFPLLTGGTHAWGSHMLVIEW